MARKWSDVAASAAFQALSFEEQEEARRQYFEEIISPQVPESDVSLARDQFFADTAIRPSAGGGRGFINPPMAGQPQPTVTYSEPARAPAPVDYGQVATDMMGGSVPMARSVLDQPGPVPQTPGYDPMLNQGYVAEVRRDIIGKAAPEDRMGLLTTLAENRTDVLGRAARQILAEAQAENKRINLDQEGRAQRLLDAPRGPGNLPPPRPGAGVAPPPVPIPDVTPGFSDLMDGRSAQQIAERRQLAQGMRAADEGSRMDEVKRFEIDRSRTPGEYMSDLGVRLEQGGIMARQVIANSIDPTSSWAAELAQKMKAAEAELSTPEQYRAQQFASKLAQQPNEWAKGAVMLAEFVTNPTIAVEEVVRQGPLMGAMIAATVFGGGVGGLAVRGAAAVAPKVALADAISGGMVASAGRAAGAAATARGAAAVAAGGDAAGQVYEELTSKKNAQLMRENADVKRLMDEGKTFEEARNEVALTKARLAQSIAATGGVIFGAAGFEGLLAKKIAGQAVGGTAKRAAVTEITTELADELTTLGASNFAIGQIDPNRALTQDFGQTAATTLVTTSPTAGASAYLASREQGVDPLTDAYARANLSTTNPSEEFISPTQTARSAMDVGPSAPARNDAGLIGSTINFTPPDSITAQAGLAPIVVPTAPGSVGGTDVGLPNVLGGLAGGSGVAGGSDPLAGLGGAGRDAAVPGAGGVNAAGALAGDGGAALPGVGAPQPGPSLSAGRGERATSADLLARAEQAAGLPPAPAPEPAGAPAEIWAGRAGDGYAQEQDAQQALPKLQVRYPDLSWSLQQSSSGRFFWSGTTRGDASGTAVTGAAGQGLAGAASGNSAQQAEAAGAGMVGLGQSGSGQPAVAGGAATLGGAAANEPAFSLKLAPPAPLRAAGQAITLLKNSRGVDVELHAGDLTDQQKVASAMARLVGKTVTYMDYVAGPADKMPNGFVITGKEQNIYLDSNSNDGALFVMMHEGVHALPEPIREKLVTTIKGLTKIDMRADFAQNFQYDINNESLIDNEIAAFMTQAVTKRQDFWQELRTKMGDGDFTEVAKVILDKLNTFIQGAQSAYGDDFIQRYATDAVAVRDAVSTAYADAMKAQGQQVSGAATTPAAPGITASNRVADVNPLGMYSELARKIDAGPGQAMPDQWRGYIRGLTTKGVKPDEIEWSGVEDFLELKRAAGQKVTKAEVAEYLQQGGVRVEETVLSDEAARTLPEGWQVRRASMVDDASLEWALFDNEGEIRGEGNTYAEALEDGWDPDVAADGTTKYSQYTLPGGENYREVLLTLPGAKENPALRRFKELDRIFDQTPEQQEEYNRLGRELYPNGTPRPQEQVRTNESTGYRSNHWDQPNVLAHIRVNDRTDADGKRVLFVEELQSDWGQEGKKKGFQSDKDINPTDAEIKEYFDLKEGADPADYRQEMIDRERRIAKSRGVPAAPFVATQKFAVFKDGKEVTRTDKDGKEVKQRYASLEEAQTAAKKAGGEARSLGLQDNTEGWLNLALKRVMVMAAEGGYDKVAFTTGAQNAERFSLDKSLREIAYEPAGDGKYEITATDLQGREVISEDEVGLDRIEELVGKEIAEKVSRDEGERDAGGYREWRYLRGDNLKVEAKGMRAFYDTIVPTALKKLLLKVGGGQVIAATIDVQGRPESGTGLQERREYQGPTLGVFEIRAVADDPNLPSAIQSQLNEVADLVRRGQSIESAMQQAGSISAAQALGGDMVPLSEVPSQQLGFDITPAMREKVATSGLPMFSNKVKEGAPSEQAAEAIPEAPARTPRRGTEAVGDFDVRTMKDGTIVVYGDAEAIRAQIPEDVKGRNTKEGIVFTNASAPRVKAALAGRKTAYSRGGAVLDKLPMKDGKYLGAPEKYNTPGKIVALRKQLRMLTLEGERGRYWYENSSLAILRMTGGNVQEARKFVALLAIYSPQARVDSNSTFALRAWAQYKAGQPISVKTGVQDKKATEAMADVDAFWSGEKTGNFFFNLLRKIDNSTAGKQGATIDMWMMRAAEYSNDAPTATQYAFMENETNRIAQEMGWEPQQVQAAIWVAMKARMENKGVKQRTEATSEKKGWIRFDYPMKNGRPFKTRVILKAQDHRDNWLKHAMEHVPTKEDTEQAKFDFADGVGRHIGQLSFEARPGRSTGVLDGIHAAPYAQQVEFQQAVQRAFYDENGVDMLAVQIGLLSEPSDIMRPGVWQGDVSPSTQKRVAMAPAGGDAGKSNVDSAQAELLNLYASVVGLVGRQEGVGWHRPFYAGTKRDANGLDIDIGRALKPDEARALEAAIGKWMKDNGHANWQDSFALISSPTGIRAVNFGIITNEILQSEIVKVAEGVLPNFDYRVFASSGDMPTNDWKANPNGQGYVQRIGAAGRSDVLDWARSVLAPRVQRVFEQFAEKYQWGDPGRIQFGNRFAGDGGGRDQGRSLAPLPGAPVIQGATGPDPKIVQVAEQYAKDNGIPLRRQATYAQVNPGLAKRISDAYEAMPHAPEDPKVKEAYENLIRQTVAQYRALEKAGYKFWFFDDDTDPYAGNPWNAIRELRATQSMGVYATEAGFGSSSAESDNAMLADTGMKWPYGSPDGPLKRVLANDLFRAVHDVFGHGVEGAGFREHGEENAWQAHARLYTGTAVAAITSETRGQNSWLNFNAKPLRDVVEDAKAEQLHPDNWRTITVGEHNRTADVKDTVFADQKTGLMPKWTWTEGRVGDAVQASNRAAPEMAAPEPAGPVSVILGGRTMRVPAPAIAIEKLDAKINRYSELLKCLQ